MELVIKGKTYVLKKISFVRAGKIFQKLEIDKLGKTEKEIKENIGSVVNVITKLSSVIWEILIKDEDKKEISIDDLEDVIDFDFYNKLVGEVIKALGADKKKR